MDTNLELECDGDHVKQVKHYSEQESLESDGVLFCELEKKQLP